MKNIISATVLSALFMFNAQAADTMDKTHEVKAACPARMIKCARMVCAKMQWIKRKWRKNT